MTNNYITISNSTRIIADYFELTGYKDITTDYIRKIADNKEINYVQISEELPEEGYSNINKILAARPEMVFRIFNLCGYNHFDISFLKRMNSLKKLQIDCSIKEHGELIDFNVLKELKLKSLYLNVFDLKDYSFIKDLSEDIESITILPAVSSGRVLFDCKWLLKYSNLKYLEIEKKASKNLESICELKKLNELKLIGCSINALTFLENMRIKRLSLNRCSDTNLDSLVGCISLEGIELCANRKLNDISIISELTNLTEIKLQDMKQISTLPRLDKLKRLKSIRLINTNILKDYVDESIKGLVRYN